LLTGEREVAHCYWAMTPLPKIRGFQSQTDFAVTHPLRPMLFAGTITLITFAAGASALGYITYGIVPPTRWWPLISAVALFVVVWLILIIVMWMRQPDAKETVLVWGHASRSIIIIAQILVAWTIWSFFPACPETLRMMIAGLFLTTSPAQMIAAPENVAANRFGIIASDGSLALYFFADGSPHALAMGAYAAAFGTLLFAMCGYAVSTVMKTVDAQLATDNARRELEAALALVAEERDAKTRFIATASHDLGQPLQAASLFFDQTLRAPDATVRDIAADGVRRAFASADQLLSHMLNHLRLEADAVDPHFSKLAVGPVLARVVAQFGPAAQAAGIQFTVTRSSVRLRLDRVLLERALGNLINNAIVHSGATRILVGVHSAEKGRVRLWVIDDGVGIARVDGERIFEDYFRGSDSRAATKSGFGLGLSSVKRISALLEGEAGLDPRWLNGAAFYLDFPALSAPTRKAKEPLT
jgi:signal transduction histidine kinase